jgi:hypothetical protein
VPESLLLPPDHPRGDPGGLLVLGDAGAGTALLVLGHRHPAAAGLRGRGSTARTVLAALPCPVLVLGPRVLDAASSEAEGPWFPGTSHTRAIAGLQLTSWAPCRAEAFR